MPLVLNISEIVLLLLSKLLVCSIYVKFEEYCEVSAISFTVCQAEFPDEFQISDMKQ